MPILIVKLVASASQQAPEEKPPKTPSFWGFWLHRIGGAILVVAALFFNYHFGVMPVPIFKTLFDEFLGYKLAALFAMFAVGLYMNKDVTYSEEEVASNRKLFVSWYRPVTDIVIISWLVIGAAFIGFAEEIWFRYGATTVVYVMTVNFLGVLPSHIIALLVTSLYFGLGHISERIGFFWATCFGVFYYLVAVFGSVLLAVAFHFALDAAGSLLLYFKWRLAVIHGKLFVLVLSIKA